MPLLRPRHFLPARACLTRCVPRRWHPRGTTEGPRWVPEVDRVTRCGWVTCGAVLCIVYLTTVFSCAYCSRNSSTVSSSTSARHGGHKELIWPGMVLFQSGLPSSADIPAFCFPNISFPVCPESRRNGLEGVRMTLTLQILSGGGCPWRARDNRLASAAGKHHDSEVMSNGAVPGILWIAGEDEPAFIPCCRISRDDCRQGRERWSRYPVAE